MLNNTKYMPKKLLKNNSYYIFKSRHGIIIFEVLDNDNKEVYKINVVYTNYKVGNSKTNLSPSTMFFGSAMEYGSKEISKNSVEMYRTLYE